MAESPGVESPRKLRITYEIYVPTGLRRNIQFRRVEQAVDRITGAVQGAVTTSFPWADRLKVRSEWSYAWADWEDKFKLPPTGENTVSPAEEQDGKIDSEDG